MAAVAPPAKPPVKWQVFCSYWQDLGSSFSAALETAFLDSSITAQTIRRNGVNYKFNLTEMTWRSDPLRRCKSDASATCSYFDGVAFCDFDAHVSCLIMDAAAAGRVQTRFYMNGDRAYDLFLSAPATQVNVASGTVRPVHIPFVPSGAEYDEDADDSDDEEDAELEEVLSGMPDELTAPLMCPITQKAMRCPVVAADGFTYERKAIVRWLLTKNKSPLTGKPLSDQSLRPNKNVKSLVDTLRSTKTAAEKPASKKRSAAGSSSVSKKRMKPMSI